MKLKREDMLKWNVKSSEEPGRHTVITPDIHECVYTHIDRLNLPAGENYTVKSGEYEYFLSLIEGKAVITVEGKDAEDMSRLDGLYLAGNTVSARRKTAFSISPMRSTRALARRCTSASTRTPR